MKEKVSVYSLLNYWNEHGNGFVNNAEFEI